MKYTIAAFDFDGTITTKDTLWEFIKKTHNPFVIFLNFTLASPFLLLYKVGLMNNSEAKQKLFSLFYKGWSVDKFNDACLSFISTVDGCIRHEIYQKLKTHLASGHKVIIVSASIENWISPWAEKEGIELIIATRLEISPQGILTGRFSTRNCYGPEKAERILQQFPERDNYFLVAYGDSEGDTEMLNMADEKCYLN